MLSFNQRSKSQINEPRKVWVFADDGQIEVKLHGAIIMMMLIRELLM